MTYRRSRDCRQCTFHIQEDSSKWVARDCAHSFLILLSVGLYGRSLGLWQGVQLVRQHDRRRRSLDLVWHLRHLHPLLRWHEGSRNRPYEAAIRLSPPALCGMVRCHRLLYYQRGECRVYQLLFILSLISTQFVLKFSGWSVFLRGNWTNADFVTNYLPLITFPILYVGAKFWKRSRTVRASEMDFYTGLAEIEADTYDEPPPKNRVEAIWQWLVSDRAEAFCMRPLIAFYIDVKGRYLSCDQLHSFIELHCVL